ncbi:MAG: secretin N-terminal domain-containing protein [Vampirovibrionales bacterium]|nr:secretin N-terminal domain-containing protein [Vampirovibrionales bacterium]
MNRLLLPKKNSLALLMALGLVCQSGILAAGPAYAQSQSLPTLEQVPSQISANAQEQRTLPSAVDLFQNRSGNSVNEITRLLTLSGAQKKVSMKLRGVPLPDALRALAAQGGFSVVVDESVEGDVNVDLNNVTLQHALNSFKAYGNLAYAVEGKSLIVAKADSERAKSFERAYSKVIPLQNANARILSQILNQAVFGITPQQQTQTATRTVGYDYHTNSLIVSGSSSDIDIIQDHVRALDMPRETRTWRLSHANAVDVASMLSSSLFNEGMPSFTVGGAGGGAAGGAAMGNGNQNNVILQPAMLNVQQERIEEGTGASQANAASGSSGGTGGATVNSQVTLRARVKEDQQATVSANGPIIVPDSRMNTITLMGTAEQIAMAESIIPTLDRKVPQVVLETSVIELTERQLRQIGHNFGVETQGLVFGSSNTGAATSGQTGVLTGLDEVIFGYTTNPIQRLRNDFQYQLNLLDRQQKLKLLANPTIITAHDNEAVISIVDEVIRRNELTVNAAGDIAGSEAEIGDVGVVVNILPKIGANGMVSLRIRPTVSSISDTIVDPFSGIITLVSRRELLVQNVVMKDGESFILGGLLSNTDNQSNAKIPGLGDIPIIGQLGRNNARDAKRTELIIVITPHILNDESDMAQANSHSPMKPVNINGGRDALKPSGDGFLPVSRNGYQVEESPNNYLPKLQPVHALNSQSMQQKSKSLNGFSGTSLKPPPSANVAGGKKSGNASGKSANTQTVPALRGAMPKGGSKDMLMLMRAEEGHDKNLNPDMNIDAMNDRLK